MKPRLFGSQPIDKLSILFIDEVTMICLIRATGFWKIITEKHGGAYE